jgi:hypothetical protein
MWSEFLATDSEVRDRIPALPHFLRSSESGMGSIQPRSTNEELLERRSSGSGLEAENTAVRIRCAEHTTPTTPKIWHQLLRQAAGGRSVGIVHSRTKATKFSF